MVDIQEDILLRKSYLKSMLVYADFQSWQPFTGHVENSFFTNINFKIGIP